MAAWLVVEEASWVRTSLEKARWLKDQGCLQRTWGYLLCQVSVGKNQHILRVRRGDKVSSRELTSFDCGRDSDEDMSEGLPMVRL